MFKINDKFKNYYKIDTMVKYFEILKLKKKNSFKH